MIKIRGNIAISENGFVFNPQTGESFTMNESGLEILKTLKNGITENDLKAQILTAYQIDPETLDRYYLDFVGMLRQFNIIENE